MDEVKETVGKDRKPWQNVLLMELEYMNTLCVTIIKSLIELKQGLDGSLSINDAMEAIMNSFMIEQVPLAWAKFA